MRFLESPAYPTFHKKSERQIQVRFLTHFECGSAKDQELDGHRLQSRIFFSCQATIYEMFEPRDIAFALRCLYVQRFSLNVNPVVQSVSAQKKKKKRCLIRIPAAPRTYIRAQ